MVKKDAREGQLITAIESLVAAMVDISGRIVDAGKQMRKHTQ